MAAGVALFLGTKFGVNPAAAAPTLATLEARAVDLDTALTNGKPSLVEFYADWCAECRAMAPTVAAVEGDFDRDVNFVMVNVDNPKWYGELDEYGVDGIPHFAFLSGDDTERARMVGVLPREVMAANLDALRAGRVELPYSRPVAGLEASASSVADTPAAAADAAASDPRAHG